MSRAALFAFIAANLAAGASQAATEADVLRAAVMPQKAISRPGDAPNARILLPSAYSEAYALRMMGVAKTSVSETEDDITRSLGFLCGLQPGQKPTGAAAARGYDPNGRFLGAKLSIALK